MKVSKFWKLLCSEANTRARKKVPNVGSNESKILLGGLETATVLAASRHVQSLLVANGAQMGW